MPCASVQNLWCLFMSIRRRLQTIRQGPPQLLGGAAASGLQLMDRRRRPIAGAADIGELCTGRSQLTKPTCFFGRGPSSVVPLLLNQVLSVNTCPAVRYVYLWRILGWTRIWALSARRGKARCLAITAKGFSTSKSAAPLCGQCDAGQEKESTTISGGLTNHCANCTSSAATCSLRTIPRS